MRQKKNPFRVSLFLSFMLTIVEPDSGGDGAAGGAGAAHHGAGSRTGGLCPPAGAGAEEDEEFYRTHCTDVLVNDCADAAAFEQRAYRALETILKEEQA